MNTPATITAQDAQDFSDATDIIAASGQREGLRRLRQLRAAGHVIIKKRSAGNSREFLYQLAEAQ